MLSCALSRCSSTPFVAYRTLCCGPKTANCSSTKKQEKPKATTDKKEQQKEQQKTQSAGRTADEYVRKFLKSCSFCAVGLASLMGSAAARKAGMSPVGCAVLSFVQGMGGGSMRDILLGKRVYWLKDTRFAVLCAGTGLLGAFGWEELKRRTGIRDDGLWARLISMGSIGGCTCGGAETAMGLTSDPLGQLVCGAGLAMLSATGGGCVRDYMLGRRPAVLYPEGLANVFPAAVGAFAYQTARRAHAPLVVQTAVGFVTSCGLRDLMKHYAAARKAAATSAAAAAAHKATRCRSWFCRKH